MSGGMLTVWAVRGAAIAVSAAIMCAALIVVLAPALRRYALATPNARSSHREPTPQGGGIAVVIATIAAVALGLFGFDLAMTASLAMVIAAFAGMALVGAIDDIHPIGVAPRLVMQALAVATVIYALPNDLRVVPTLPGWVERLSLLAAGLWFVNLVNFMDGIDWMTVAEVIPITVALIAMGWCGALSLQAIAVALALGGAMIGFAYFNRPVAKLFLGDVGSLPIGLLLGWLLVLLAGDGHLAAALLLPLYYLADATLTLVHRLLRGERIWQAHRTHFYQRATDRGFTVTAIVARVFAVNIGLTALALLTLLKLGRAFDIAELVCGATLVAWLLYVFAYGRPGPNGRR